MHLGQWMIQRWQVVVPAALLLIIAVTAAALLVQPSDVEAGALRTTQLPKVDIPGPCESGATKPFTPTSVDIEDVRDGVSVVAFPRDGQDVPGVPSVGATHTVAFDAPGPHPGAREGLVRLNAHTWPNGGALGNEMLANFDVGDILTLRDGDKKVCYRVTERAEVTADATYDRFFQLDGKPEFAFIVCSGERRGPGDWSMRTVWWGEPITN